MRAFTEEEHAFDFIAGKVRVGLLVGYRAAEDARRDEAEGIVRVVWRMQHPVYCDRSSMNSYYVLSTAHPETDRRLLAARFGSHVVRINDPIELLRRLDAAWQRNPFAEGRCLLASVVYNKGELQDPVPALLPPYFCAFTQKPRVPFGEERELRYVLTCTADVLKLRALLGEDLTPERHLTLSLPNCGDICSMT